MAKNDQVKITFKVFNEDFNKAMNEMKQGTTQLNREFKLQNSQMKLTGSEADKLRASVDYLSTRYEQAKERVRLTEQQLEKAKKAFGENSEAVKELEGKLTNAKLMEQDFSNQLTVTSKALKDAEDPMKKYRESIKKISDNLKSAGEKMTNFGKNMTTKVTLPIVGGLTAAAKGSEEFRADLAKLVTNAENAGMGAKDMTDALVILSAVSDETDSNVEALSNLLATGFSQNGMMEAMDALSGAVIKFPDTLKIEGLADGLQETLATGKAIGPFSELLERSGVNLDTFNEGLATAQKEGKGENYILKTLADTGLAKVNEAYRENNKELVNSREENQKFQLAISELGDVVQPVITEITKAGTKLVSKFNELSPTQKKITLTSLGIVAAVGPLLTIFGQMSIGIGAITTAYGALNVAKIADKAQSIYLLALYGKDAVAKGISTAGTIGMTAATTAWNIVAGIGATATSALGTAIAFLTSPIGIAVAAIAAIIAIGVLLYKNWDTVKEKAGQLGSWLSEKWDGIKSKTSKAWANVRATISAAIGVAKDTVHEKLTNMKTAFDENGGGLKGSVAAAWEGIKGYYSLGFTFIDKLTGGKLTALKNMFSEKMNSAKDTVGNAINKIKGFFNFQWSLPKIKLPHFNISGKFSLNPPQIPKFKVSWFSEGVIFKKPTVLNGIGVGDGYKGTGSRMEAILPISKLAGLIRDVMPKDNFEPAVVNNIKFNGNYQFRDENDIDYFMHKAAMIIKGEGK